MQIRFILFAALAAMATIPIALFGVWQLPRIADAKISAASDQYLVLAGNLGHALERYDRDLRALFRLVVSSAIADTRTGDVRPVVDNFHIRHVCIVRRDNPAIVDTAIVGGAPCPVRVPDDRFAMFQQLAKPGEVNYSPVVVTPEDGPTIYLVMPVGDLIAFGAIETDYFVELGEQITFGVSGHAVIVDNTGRAVFHPKPDWRRRAHDISKVPAVEHMRAGETGVMRFHSPAFNREMITGFTSVLNTGWGVMVVQATDELRAEAEIAQWFVIAIGAAGLLVAAAIAWLLSGLLTRPLQAVAEAATAMAGGNLAARAPAAAMPRELGGLASSFNSMAATVETAVNQQEASLRRAEAAGNRLGAVFDNAHAIIAIKDRDGRYLRAGRHLCELMGMTEDEVIGHTAREVFPSADADIYDEQDRRTLEKRQVTEQIVHYQTRHGPRDYYAVKFPVPNVDGRRAGIGVVATDITDRLLVEEQLRQSEGMKKAVFEASQDVILLLDRNGIVLDINHTGAERLEVAPGKIIGRDLFEFLPPHVAENRRELLSQVIGRGEPMRFDDRRGDRWFDIIAQPIFGEDGAVERIALFARDVTDRRNLEERLAHAQKLEAVGELTGGVAHEFNNLLMVLRGNLELLQGALALGETLVPVMARCVRAVDRGAHLTGQLLSFARKHPVRPEVCDLTLLVREEAAMLEQMLGETYALRVKASDTIEVEVDPRQLEQALLNLVINARDAMPNGGTIAVNVYRTTLTAGHAARLVEDLAAGDYAVIDVVDTGPGMTPEQISRAFEPFYSTKEVGKGTGLGLSMVYGFARQSGGATEIVGQSDIGGACIRIYLPIDKAVHDGETKAPGRGAIGTDSAQISH